MRCNVKELEMIDGYVLLMLYHLPYLVPEETLRYSDLCYISKEKIVDWPTTYVGRWFSRNAIMR